MSHALHIPADKGNVRSLSIRALKHENALLDRVSWRAVTSAWKPVAVLHWEMQQHGKEEDEIFLKCEARGMQTLTYLLGVKYTHNVFWWGYGKIAFFLCGAYYCFNDGRVLRSSPRCWSCCRKQRGELSWVLSLILPLPTEPEHSANSPRHTINDTWLQSFGSLSRRAAVLDIKLRPAFVERTPAGYANEQIYQLGLFDSRMSMLFRLI